MDEEIYLWLESRSGETFDVDDKINSLLVNDLIVTDTDQWEFALSGILTTMNNCLNAIDEHWREIPDNLPSRTSMKNLYYGHVMNGINTILQKAFSAIGLDVPSRLSDVSVIQLSSLINACNTLLDLIRALKDNTVDDLIRANWYEKYEDEHDEALMSQLHVARQDLANISFAIATVNEIYSDNSDE